MKSRQNIVIGLLIWIASLGIVLGSLILSLSEGGLRAPQLNTATVVQSEVSQVVLTTNTIFPSPTPTPSASETLTALPTMNPTQPAATTPSMSPTYPIILTVLISPTITPQPSLTTTSSSGEISQSKTRKHCNPPPNWMVYQVRRGESLLSISLKFNTSVTALQRGNCLGTVKKVKAGRKIYVPRPAIWFFAYPTQHPSEGNKNQKVIPPPLTPIPVTPRSQELPAINSLSLNEVNLLTRKTGTILAIMDDKRL